jgi:Zn finger protein HypA/HybF involved in hydrogenase expression
MYLTTHELECECGCVWVMKLPFNERPFDEQCPQCGSDRITVVEVGRS